MSVVLAGGGTAGHISPALALADALRRADPRLPLVFLGTERGLETRLVPLHGYELTLIPAVPLPRSLSPQLASVPRRLSGAVAAASAALEAAQAGVLVGFGGYVATPGYLAARRCGVPIVVHEANARPGLANRIGARLTRHVFTGQPGTRLAHSTYIGTPVRRQVAGLDRLALGDKARAHFGLRPDLPVLLVTGGSQGARSLNRAAFGAAEPLRAAGVQVLHIAGPRSDLSEPPPGDVPYVVLPYLDQMDLAYAAADFALCRAGAMTCAELTAVGLPAAYVPLPHGNGEQLLNALPIEEAGGGVIVADGDLTPGWILENLLPVLQDAELLAAMSRAAAGVGRPGADTELAAAVLGVLRDHGAPGRRARRRRGGTPRGRRRAAGIVPATSGARAAGGAAAAGGSRAAGGLPAAGGAPVAGEVPGTREPAGGQASGLAWDPGTAGPPRGPQQMGGPGGRC